MQIRVTLTADELKQFDVQSRAYKNKDGTFRIYFNSLDDFLDALKKQ